MAFRPLSWITNPAKKQQITRIKNAQKTKRSIAYQVKIILLTFWPVGHVRKFFKSEFFTFKHSQILNHNVQLIDQKLLITTNTHSNRPANVSWCIQTNCQIVCKMLILDTTWRRIGWANCQNVPRCALPLPIVAQPLLWVSVLWVRWNFPKKNITGCLVDTRVKTVNKQKYGDKNAAYKTFVSSLGYNWIKLTTIWNDSIFYVVSLYWEVICPFLPLWGLWMLEIWLFLDWNWQ